MGILQKLQLSVAQLLGAVSDLCLFGYRRRALGIVLGIRWERSWRCSEQGQLQASSVLTEGTEVAAHVPSYPDPQTRAAGVKLCVTLTPSWPGQRLALGC